MTDAMVLSQLNLKPSYTEQRLLDVVETNYHPGPNATEEATKIYHDMIESRKEQLDAFKAHELKKGMKEAQTSGAISAKRKELAGLA